MSKTFLFLKARNKKEKFIQKCLLKIKTCFVLACIVFGVGLSGAAVNAQEVTADTLAGVFIGRAGRPVVLFPHVGEVVKENSIEVSGQSDNDTTVNIYVDDVLDGTVQVKSGEGFKGTFSAHLNVPLSLGAHVIYVIARSTDKLASEKSGEVIITYNPNAILQPPAPAVVELPVEEPAVQALTTPSVRVTAPTLRTPEWNTIVKAVHPVIDGVGRNGQTVAVYIDDKLDGTIVLGTHASGAVGFAYQSRQKLASGWHEVYAYSFNADSLKSAKSGYLRFYLEVPFIAPTLRSARQIGTIVELTGVAANGSLITVFVDGTLDGKISDLKPHPSGVTSFAYTLSALPAPGMHQMSAKAYDANGKASLLSNTIALSAVTPPVAEEKAMATSEKKDESQSPAGAPLEDKSKEDTASVQTTEPVKNEKEAKKEPEESKAEEKKQPPVQEKAGAKDEKQEEVKKDVEKKDAGKIDEKNTDEAVSGEEVKKESAESALAETGKVVNWSLVVGVIILAGLIIAFLIWYILQRRDMVNDGIKRLFGDEVDEWGEDEESSFGEFAGDEEKASVQEALQSEAKPSGKEAPSKKEELREESKTSEKKDKEPAPSSPGAGKDEPQKKTEDRVKDAHDMKLPPPPPDL